MTGHRCWGFCGLLACGLGAGSAAAQIDVVLTLEDARTLPYYERFGAYVFEGTTAYTVLRGEIPDPYAWVSQVTRVDVYGTVPAATELVSFEEWAEFTGTNPYYPDGDHLLPGNRIAVLGTYVQFLCWSTDAVYRVHKGTGRLYRFVSNRAIRTHTGLPEADMIDAVAFSSDGKMAFYEQDSDSVLLAEVNDSGDLTTNGTIRTLISDAEFDALYAHSPINNVSGGMTFDRQGNLYWTLSQTGSTGPPGGAIYKRQASDGSLSRILGPSDIWAATGRIGNVAFNDIYAAPDGNVYFFDRRNDVDAILYFHPGNPVGTLTVFLSEADIQAGPFGNREVNIDAFRALGNRLTWHHLDTFTPVYAAELAGFPCDFDQDGDVDLQDAGGFQGCFGPMITTNGPCAPVDFNTNGVIDREDWVPFAARLVGPG